MEGGSRLALPGKACASLVAWGPKSVIMRRAPAVPGPHLSLSFARACQSPSSSTTSLLRQKGVNVQTMIHQACSGDAAFVVSEEWFEPRQQDVGLHAFV